jgi:hypothetical protein
LASLPSSAPTADQLQALLGGSARIGDLEHLAPWSVLRCRLQPSTGRPAESVIVKWLRGGDLRIDPRQMATERAALEFLAQIGFSQAPRLIAADAATSVLVLQDLAPRMPLSDLLRRQGLPDSIPGLRAFAQVIGQLNAATAGRSALYDQIREGYGPCDPLAGWTGGTSPRWPNTLALLASLGLAVSAAVERDLADVAGALLNPGPFLAFSNGDCEANNVLVEGEDAVLIDFEFAAYRHALLCAVWMHVPGPAWITVTDPISLELEEEYRRALCAGIPEAQDDRLFGFGLTAASLAAACDRLNRFPELDARPSGHASRVQMVSTLEAAAGVARRWRALPALAEWTEQAAQWLRRRWTDADVDLSLYGAYAPRG